MRCTQSLWWDTSAGSTCCPACLETTVALSNSHLSSFGQGIWQLSLMLSRVAALAPPRHVSSLDAQHMSQQAGALLLVPAGVGVARSSLSTAATWLSFWKLSKWLLGTGAARAAWLAQWSPLRWFQAALIRAKPDVTALQQSLMPAPAVG